MTSPRKQLGDRDGGFSFVETVIAVAIVGVIAVPLLTALASLIRSSADLAGAAEADNVMSVVADDVSRVVTGDTCWRAADYRAEVNTVLTGKGWPATSTVTVKHRVAQESGDMVGDWVDSACPPAGSDATYVQLLIIRVTSPSGDTRTLRMVKGVV